MSAKILARVVAYKRTDVGQFTWTVEFKFVSGADRGGRMQCETDVTSDSQVIGDIKDALITHLEATFPPERLRRHHIVGLAI